MAPARRRPETARARAEHVHPRHLPRPRHRARRGGAGRAGLPERAIPARDAGRGRGRGHLLPYRRRRHRARRRGRVLRAGRQPARALGRVLHAGEPQDVDAADARRLRPHQNRTRGALPRPAAGQSARGRAARRRRAHRGGADAGHVQLGLFRARLPGAADGRGAGRGPGSVRRTEHGLHAHHAGPAQGGRDLPPAGRRFPGPAVVPR